MKNKKKILILLILVLLCLLILTFVQIYAKYLSSATGNSKMNIARWDIKVNNSSIKNSTDISALVIPVFPGNDNMAPGIIAPNAEGYFDLNLDFQNADVSFKYLIETSADESSSVSDIVSTGYSLDDGPKVNFKTFNESIADTIPLNSNVKNRKVRIYVKWNDDADLGATMDNAADTSSAKSDIPAILNVKLSFTQIFS